MKRYEAEMSLENIRVKKREQFLLSLKNHASKVVEAFSIRLLLCEKTENLSSSDSFKSDQSESESFEF